MIEDQILLWVCILVINTEKMPLVARICAVLITAIQALKLSIFIWSKIHG